MAFAAGVRTHDERRCAACSAFAQQLFATLRYPAALLLNCALRLSVAQLLADMPFAWLTLRIEGFNHLRSVCSPLARVLRPTNRPLGRLTRRVTERRDPSEPRTRT